jgi:hypothetical protein
MIYSSSYIIICARFAALPFEKEIRNGVLSRTALTGVLDTPLSLLGIWIMRSEFECGDGAVPQRKRDCVSGSIYVMGQSRAVLSPEGVRTMAQRNEDRPAANLHSTD